MAYSAVQFRYGAAPVVIGDHTYHKIEHLSISALDDTLIQPIVHVREDSAAGILWGIFDGSENADSRRFLFAGFGCAQRPSFTRYGPQMAEISLILADYCSLVMAALNGLRLRDMARRWSRFR
jgi:hypothetical protein